MFAFFTTSALDQYDQVGTRVSFPLTTTHVPSVSSVIRHGCNSSLDAGPYVSNCLGEIGDAQALLPTDLGNIDNIFWDSRTYKRFRDGAGHLLAVRGSTFRSARSSLSGGCAGPLSGSRKVDSAVDFVINFRWICRNVWGTVGASQSTGRI